MKKLIIAVLIGFILSFGVSNVANADKKYADKGDYAVLQSKRKAKRGKAVLKSTFKIRKKYRKHKRTRTRTLKAYVTMTAYFTRKSKKSKVKVRKIVIKTKNKTRLPLYYSQIGITTHGSKHRSGKTYNKRKSASMHLFKGHKIKTKSTIKYNKTVNSVDNVFSILNDSMAAAF